MTTTTIGFKQLRQAAHTFPAIDNHAHPLLKEAHRSSPHFPFDARATKQLSLAYGISSDATWDDIKAKRAATDYKDLCFLLFKDLHLMTILLDDGLSGVEEYAEEIGWHDKLTQHPCWRIARIETIAEFLKSKSRTRIWKILCQSFVFILMEADTNWNKVTNLFSLAFKKKMRELAQQPFVKGFKSIVCYRTGLDVDPRASIKPGTLKQLCQTFEKTDQVRIASKDLNDWLVCAALEICGEFGKPMQFHTGLGDKDLSLLRASPAHLRPIIEAYPESDIVILHSAYPYTREAGYMTAMYKNVYLDFGEIFPFISASGQKSVLKEIFEMTPTDKILWSTDGHWWPESYYLAVIQSRQALFEVLSEHVQSEELTEKEAIDVVENALFYNSNKLYKLGLSPVS
ncbi:amidohydrolase 2, partial [Flagelloscypha sp. PMI_526]